MNMGSMIRGLGVVLFVVVLSCALPQMAKAQDDSQSGTAELFKQMYEGGLISAEEYEFAARVGHLPNSGAPSESSTTTTSEPDARESTVETVSTVPDIKPVRFTRSLALAGQPVSLSDLQQHKERALAARAISLRSQQAREREEAKTYSARYGVPLRESPADGAALEMIAVRNGLPLFYTTDNRVAADTVSTDKVWPTGGIGFALTGSNTVIGMWDEDAVRRTHQEFYAGGVYRVTQMDGETNLSYHSTAVAGTLMAAGYWTNARGMSYQAALSACDWLYDLSEMADAVVSNGLRLSNHSYSFSTGWESNSAGFWVWYGDLGVSPTQDYKFGFYLQDARDIDEISYDGTYYLSVWSAANERDSQDLGPASQPIYHYAYTTNGFVWTNRVHDSDGDAGGYDTLSPQASAKNALTVGAVEDIPGGYTSTQDVVLASFSSLGPTDDGRIKPDLVANGVALITAHSQTDSSYVQISGTSFSAPSLAGSLNLIRQLYTTLHGTNYPMWASTLKGLAIHTADEAGSTSGPDYRFGWGLLNTEAACRAITNDVQSESKAHIKEIILQNGDYIEFPAVVSNSSELRVTICWTDLPGPVPALAVDPTNRILVNDLDLRVISPTGVTNFPWVLNPATPSAAATTGDNSRDNVEQVVLKSPSNGVHTVRVTHKGTLSNDLQNVSVLISGNQAQPKPDLELVRFDRSTAPTNTLEWPTVAGQLSRIESSTNLMEEFWTVASGDISATRTNVIFGVETNPTPEVLFYRVVDLN